MFHERRKQSGGVPLWREPDQLFQIHTPTLPPSLTLPLSHSHGLFLLIAKKKKKKKK
jgi:hypothetical protein